MKHFLWTIGIIAGLYITSALASEEFDPMLYPDQETDSPHMRSSVIASPKFIDDEDFNFDDVDSALPEDTTTSNPRSEAPTPERAVNIPMIQKTPDSQEVPLLTAIPEPISSDLSVDKNQTLTDNIKDNSSNGIKIPMPDVKGTWINKLKSPLTDSSSPKTSLSSSGSDTNLESMIDKAKRRNQRSNASVFDISGAMLRMTFAQIDETITKRGYRRATQKLDIPNFIRWRNEDKCRASGVVGYERLNNCVIKIAKRDNYEYVETASYAKYDTKETIDVKFTSSFTNNKAYKIIYKSEAANITGNSQKAIYLRNIKIYDFWKKINQKYGSPDNRDDVIWGLGGNKPYMQAGTGRLILEDPMLRELDYTRMSREDQRYMNTNLYSF